MKVGATPPTPRAGSSATALRIKRRIKSRRGRSPDLPCGTGMRSASGALRPPTPRDPDTPHLVGRGYAPDAPRRISLDGIANHRSEEHTSELQSLLRIS